MHDLLIRLLDKRGINSTKDLSQEEKDTYDKWQKQLTDGEVTVEKITEFCEQRMGVIQAMMKDPKYDEKVIMRLVLQYNVYSAMWEFINGKRQEKEVLLKYLDELLTSDSGTV